MRTATLWSRADYEEAYQDYLRTWTQEDQMTSTVQTTQQLLP